MAFVGVSGGQLLSALVLLVLAKGVWELFLSPLRAFPGPLAAKLSDCWRAFLTSRGSVDSVTRGWHEKWGSAVRIGPNTISLSDAQLIKVIYANNSKYAWKKSDMYRVNDVMVDGQRIPNIFNTQDEAFHSKYTKPISGFWTVSKILELEPLMDETISVLVKKLGSKFAEAPEPSICMMDDWLAYFSWDFAANVSFGRHYGFLEEEKDIQGMIKGSTAGLYYFAVVSQMPWIDSWLDKNPIIRIGPKPLDNGFRYTVNLVADYQRKLLDGNLDRKPVANFIDNYTGLQKTCPFADDSQVINWLMLNILAGGDSTAGALRPVVYHLAKCPRAQAELQAELGAAQLLRAPQWIAQWRDIKALPYLDAVTWEAARMNPAIGLMPEREVPPGGFQLPDGRLIPEGTKVGVNPAVVTRDARLFGGQVDSFIPERWLALPGESVEHLAQRRRPMEEATDMMFGAGSRACMGKHLAKVEIGKLIATLYSLFDIHLVDINHQWNHFNSWFMYQSDMPMIIRRRSMGP